MLRTLPLLLLVVSCATLNTAGMSEACKRSYDACLNTCPGAQQPGAPNTRMMSDLQIDVAACTNECNERAKTCK